MLSKAIISASAPQRGHQARLELRPRRTNSDSLSNVIFVCFAIETCLLKQPTCETSADCTKQACEVLTKGLKISDNFSQLDKHNKTGMFANFGLKQTD
jgi:hypothetical protein